MARRRHVRSSRVSAKRLATMVTAAAVRKASDEKNINVRLELWASFWRWKLGLDQARSFEGQYRSPQHWDAPTTPTHAIWLQHEIEDANQIESAVCSLDLFHHTLLKAWYIRRRTDNHCLRAAREAIGETRRSKGNFEASLEMAKALLIQALDEPAVVRKQRASAHVRKLLGLPPLTTLDVG